MKMYKLIVYVPVDNADQMRQVLSEAGAGKMGNYDTCSFSMRGTGRFRPLKGADPAIGEIDKLEAVEEERIETVVEEALLKSVLEAVSKHHPYEEPATEVYQLYTE